MRLSASSLKALAERITAKWKAAHEQGNTAAASAYHDCQNILIDVQTEQLRQPTKRKRSTPKSPA